MFRKNMRFRLFVCFFALLLLLSACQPTPEDAIVSQKGDLTDKIAETADPGQASTGVGSHYSLEKTFEQSGHTLIVDADITGGDESKMAVITLAEKPFESGKPLQKIVENLFPEFTVYDYIGFTKDDLQKQIEEAQLMIFRLENNLNVDTGEPLKEGEAQTVYLAESLQGKDISGFTEIELMNIYLDELKEKYEKAPENSELPSPDYLIEIPKTSSLSQDNIRVIKGNLKYNIDFVNRQDGERGSSFWVERIDNDQEFSSTDMLPKNPSPLSSMQNPDEFIKVKQILQKIGIDYMELYEIYQGEETCEYIFTRSYNGALEDYVGEYLALHVTDGDTATVQRLWPPEYFSIVMYNGELQRIRWRNPSQIVKVDNENVKILPWSEIQKIFEKQMEFLLTPSSSGGDSMFWWKPSDVKIERITLGLAKMLMKDSGEYKLIPVWNFFGRDNGNSDMDDAEEKCYATINALDGTIMDRDVMY